jgi:hypothetical protein
MPCAALGRRCGSAAYLREAGTTSAAGSAGSSSLESTYIININTHIEALSLTILSFKKYFYLKIKIYINHIKIIKKE